MQTHAGSRSRSWSRSHSPSHSREKKYPRGYHNGREFRGYHRGFRRPYNFRGRGRGFFPRGRYQRGGYNNNNNNGNNNHNFRPNWKNYKQYPEKPQQQQSQPRGRPHNPQGRSGTPPRGPANHSDRSPSPLSRHSQHSSSSSHSSSPKWKPTLLLTNQSDKEEKEALCAPGEVPKGAGGDAGGGGGGGEEPAELAGPAGEAKEGNCTGSPKGASPGASCAAVVGPNSQTTRQSSPSPKITNDIGNGAPSWKMACSSSPSTKKKLHEGLNPMLSSYDFFSNEEFLDGDKTAISVAFREFLEEQKKKKAKAFENGKNTEANDVDMEQGRMKGKPSTITSDSRRFREDTDGEVSLRSFLKASPFLSADGEEDGEAVIKPHPKPPHRDWHSGDESFKAKIKVPRSAGGVFDERPGKWQNVTFSRVVDRDADPADHAHLTRKQGKAATALARREVAGKCERLSPDVGGKARKTAKSPSIPSSTPPPRRSSDRELWGEDSHFTSSRKQEIKLNVRMDLLGDSLMRSSDILAEERQLSQDLVQSSKKDQEFRSIFQHVQAAPLQKSPSELFAQHIVTIVHHVKAQHFPSSGMTLNERFTVYQRRAAEKEMAKPRKSPEIHRRIDVSPRAFQKHSQLFEAMKNSEDGTYKDGGEKITGDPMDLRLDIERRKKCSVHDRDSNQDLGGDVGDSPDSSRDGSSEKLSKTSERSKKSQKKRPRSSSSSSSSSSKSQREDSSDPKGHGCDRAQPGQTEPTGPAERGRPPAGFQVRIRGRSWNGGSYQGNSSQRNAMTGAAPQPTDEDWDADHTERRRKYFLHDDRERGAEGKAAAADSRGRGSLPRGRAQFIVRSGGGGGAPPKWADDKFRVNGERGDARQETQRDHEDGGDT
ncbi:thyroid hormone receptor-associated protein 3 isoform X3 [Pungitius pungitius]|uniref:thyroid hormone receptor-associated protein 3 isoform X3 n=1 Tax=Pungitius pungitius TaxID=134920 RepID=UPI002E140FD9